MRNLVAVVFAVGLFVLSMVPMPTLALDLAEIGVAHETVTGPTGVRAVRSIPVNAEIALQPGEQPPEEEPLAGPAISAGGTILWIDQNHQSAVAQNLAITGDGLHVASGWWLNNSRVALYATYGSGAPDWTFPISSSFFIPVDASNDGGVITATGRQDLLYSWTAASNVPTCAEVNLPGHEGMAAFTPDVGGLFAGSATFMGASTFTHGHTTALCNDLFNVNMAGSPQGGRYAAGGAWLAVNSRNMVNVYDSQTGALRGTVAIAGETEATAGISSDGNILAIGGFSHTIVVYQWDGASYAELWNHLIPNVTWITAVDVSDDGSTVMVGTALFTTPELGRVLMYDVAAGPVPLWTNSDFGGYVDAVELSANGSRGIAGSWGRSEGTFGYVIAVFDRTSPIPFFAVEDDRITGVGSCHAVDIANDGLRAAAGGKAVHAREFGNGGYTMALDLGGVVPASAVRLTGRALGCSVELQWSSESNSEHSAFHVYRVLAGGDGGTASGTENEIRLTPEPVLPSDAAGEGRSYLWLDESTECGQSYIYRLGRVGASEEERTGYLRITLGLGLGSPPGQLVLGSSQPNPFRRSTRIPYALSQPALVRLSIFDGAGRVVRALDLGIRGAGFHLAPWDGRDLAGRPVASGVYFYRMEAAMGSTMQETATRRLVVVE